MFICIAGKNKCAVDAVRFLFSKNFKKKNILILPNNDDDGKDSWQPSLKGIAKKNKVKIANLKNLYTIKEL